MEIAEDQNASSGQYTWVPDGNGNEFDSSENSGYAEYTFEVQESGDYVIWGRVYASNIGNDSFFVSVDGSEYALWDTQV